MPANMVLIEKISVGAAGASSVTFSSIPQTGYTDLVVKASIRNNAGSATGYVLLNINGSSSTFTSRYIYGTGSAAGSASSPGTYIGEISGGTSTANTFGNLEIYIPNYTSANYKSYSVDSVAENNATNAQSALVAGLWSTTSAITSLNIASAGADIVANSTFYLYGVAKLGTTPAIVPYATGGDTIITDGTYWYHAFKSSGTFTPAKGLSCDVLVVAGGGGGGGNKAGGGGAGGVLAYSAQSAASGTGYTVTIGGGGAGGSGGSQTQGSNGSNSQFASLTASVGGGGAGTYNTVPNGLNGGSGGGAGNSGSGTIGFEGTAGTGTSGQGYAGGRAYYLGGGNANAAGGGGGAGAAGGDGGGTLGVVVNGGTGGVGLNTWSTWLNATGTGVSGYIAGGGGGGIQQGAAATGNPGAGGSGGGGAGSTGSGPVSGTANTGSGGGGVGQANGTGGAGGSGLVIVRYAI